MSKHYKVMIWVLFLQTNILKPDEAKVWLHLKNPEMFLGEDLGFVFRIKI
jgi:hypothetical protein